MFDHLAQGRFIFGVSPGALRSDAEALGMLDEDRNKLFAEAIDVILAIWERDPPYDIDFPGNRFKVTTATTRDPEIGRGDLYKPYQKPRPGDRRHGGRAVLEGRDRDGRARFPSAVGELPAAALAAQPLGELRARASATAGKTADPADWRVARTIFVADDDKTARRYGRRGREQPLPLLLAA